MDFSFTPEEQSLQEEVKHLAETSIEPIAHEADESNRAWTQANGSYQLDPDQG